MVETFASNLRAIRVQLALEANREASRTRASHATFLSRGCTRAHVLGEQINGCENAARREHVCGKHIAPF